MACVTTPSPLVYCIFQTFARLKFRHLGCLDLDDIAGLRIAAGTCRALRNRECAETHQRHRSVLLECLLDAVDHGVERTRCGSTADVCGRRDVVDQFCFIQSCPLVQMDNCKSIGSFRGAPCLASDLRCCPKNGQPSIRQAPPHWCQAICQIATILQWVDVWGRTSPSQSTWSPPRHARIMTVPAPSSHMKNAPKGVLQFAVCDPAVRRIATISINAVALSNQSVHLAWRSLQQLLLRCRPLLPHPSAAPAGAPVRSRAPCRSSVPARSRACS
jgi:hypothetical protein